MVGAIHHLGSREHFRGHRRHLDGVLRRDHSGRRRGVELAGHRRTAARFSGHGPARRGDGRGESRRPPAPQIPAADRRGPLALTFASCSWSLGSVYAKRHPTETSPYVSAAVQMIVGGTVVALVGSALGEWKLWHLSARGLGAFAYLVVFGSILGYSAYAYALRYASATVVGTYAYVNPVIAVLLGWWLLHEPVTGRTFIAMALILGAVLWIQFSHKRERPEDVEAVRPSGRQAVDPTPEATT